MTETPDRYRLNYDPAAGPPARPGAEATASGSQRGAAFDWVFFDYGGTLTREPPAEPCEPPRWPTGRALREWFQGIGVAAADDDAAMEQITVKAHRRTPGRAGQGSLEANREYERRWMAAIYDLAGVNRPVLLAELECACAFHHWKAAASGARPLGPRTLQTLDRLRAAGLRLGVISNNNGYVEDALRGAGAAERFELIIDSARVGSAKPEYRIFDVARRLTGTPAARLLYVGDSFANDVEGALAAGYHAVAWITDEPAEPALPPGTVYRISAIPELEAICLPHG